MGQAQFAQLLQPVLQELAEALADKPIVVIQNIKIVNGSKLRKVSSLNLILTLVSLVILSSLVTLANTIIYLYLLDR